jgi:hypothetical protein
MAFYDLLKKFHYIEANNLKALLPGFVVAQMEVAASDLAKLSVDGEGKFVANGAICKITKDGIKEWDGEGVPFIAYNDPLNTILPGDEYYATELESENVRLVQLIPGDEWMAMFKDGEDETAYPGLAKLISEGLAVEITEAKGQSEDDWFDMHTMPNGDAGKHYLFLGK